MNFKSYIDESGDTGYTKKSTRYFIAAAINTDDIRALRHIVKLIHRQKKGNKKGNQLHAYLETDKVKNKIVEKLRSLGISCVVAVIDKSKIITEDPYFYVLRKIAKYYFNSDVVKITIARRDMRKEYNQKIIDLFKMHGVHIEFLNPTVEKALQIADFYSWSTFVYLEQGNAEYFLKLKNSITLI